MPSALVLTLQPVSASVDDSEVRSPAAVSLQPVPSGHQPSRRPSDFVVIRHPVSASVVNSEVCSPVTLSL